MTEYPKNCVSYFLYFIVALLFLGACGPAPVRIDDKLTEPVNLDRTVSQLATIARYGEIPVRGYGIVAGLAGTGSSECPPDLRNALIKYIWKQVPAGTIDPDEFINSRDTAVVEVYGVIPSFALRNETFDVKVTALPSTQTTSLDGGTLYPVELRELSRMTRYDAWSKTLAVAEGTVFFDKLSSKNPDPLIGYGLAAARVTESVPISLALFQPNYNAASAIRNKINERFGLGAAKPTSPGQIVLTIPEKHKEQKEEFLAMVTSLYLNPDIQQQQNRINSLISELKKNTNKSQPAIAIQAVGKPALQALAPLLQSDDPLLQFYTARCMISIGDERALPVLRNIIKNPNSPYRIPAIRTLGQNARKNDVKPVLNTVLKGEDFAVRFAAYEQLQRLDDISVSRELVATSFFIDTVSCKGPKTIFVSRSGIPLIVIFGAPIYCNRNTFIRSQDGSVVINALPEKNYVSIIRKHANHPRPIGPVRSSYQLSDIIRTLGQAANPERNPNTRSGLNVSYANVIALIEQMCINDAVKAEFRAGQMANVGAILEKNTTTADNNSTAND